MGSEMVNNLLKAIKVTLSQMGLKLRLAHFRPNAFFFPLCVYCYLGSSSGELYSPWKLWAHPQHIHNSLSHMILLLILSSPPSSMPPGPLFAKDIFFPVPSFQESIFHKSLFSLKIFLNMWTIFKVFFFFNLLQYCFCFSFCFFGLKACGILAT